MGESLRVCGYLKCGRSFDAPIRLTDLSHKPRKETYYACPYCFSKVEEGELDGTGGEFGHIHSHEYRVPTEGIRTGSKLQSQKELDKIDNCPHRLGYLKTRSKSESVPDCCLTCPKILQCMV